MEDQQPKKKMYRTLLDQDVLQEYDRLYTHGPRPAISLGFEGWEDELKVMLGTMIFAYGPPASGKSLFTIFMSVLMALSEGWKVAILSKETGEAEDIYSLITSMVSGSSFTSVGMNLERKQLIQRWVAKHFIVIDHVETVDDCFESVRQIEQDFEIHIDCMIIDPWNELSHRFTDRQDLYLEQVFGRVREDAKKNNRLNVIVTHPAHIQTMEGENVDGETVRFYPITLAQQISGGQAWFRKGFNMWSFWRPPMGLKNNSGEPYPANQLVLEIQKVKPKQCGKVGPVKLFYDTITHQYYSVGPNGARHYPLKFSFENVEY